MGWDEIWATVKPLLTLPTPKMICIIDWRLGLLLRLMQALILGVISYNIMLGQTFLVKEIPKGVISLEMYDGYVNTEQIEFHDNWKNGDPEIEDMCASEDNKYNYDYGGGRFFTVTGCKALTAAQMTSKTKDTAFVSLAQESTLYKRLASDVYNNTNCRLTMLANGYNCSAGNLVNATDQEEQSFYVGGDAYWNTAELD
ncbi:hypothetical protein CYMTET_53218, partial [Cymbomonas tetramitiformis]